MAKKGSGRPPGGLTRVEVLLDPETKRRLVAEAELEGLPLYAVFQRALEEEWERLPAALREAAELYVSATQGGPLPEGEPE